MNATDRSSAGIEPPPNIPADDVTSSNVSGEVSYVSPRDADSSLAPTAALASRGAAARFNTVEGEFMCENTDRHTKAKAPDVDWLVVLGEG